LHVGPDLGHLCGLEVADVAYPAGHFGHSQVDLQHGVTVFCHLLEKIEVALVFLAED
jgi:hypothetical protein